MLPGPLSYTNREAHPPRHDYSAGMTGVCNSLFLVWAYSSTGTAPLTSVHRFLSNALGS
jgi:hypothetical protein